MYTLVRWRGDLVVSTVTSQQEVCVEFAYSPHVYVDFLRLLPGVFSPQPVN